MYLVNCALFIILGFIAVKDMTQRRIPNMAVLGLIVLGLSVSLLNPGPLFADNWISAVTASGLGFGAFLLFYLGRVMGAGDVKLAAGLGMCTGLEPLLVIWLTSIGLALAYTLMARWWPALRHSVQAVPAEGASRRFQRFVPYGALLCIATMVVLLARV